MTHVHLTVSITTEKTAITADEVVCRMLYPLDG